jgi:hypothetical protein
MAESENSAGFAKAKETGYFFEKQLAGEQPLSFDTAKELYRLAMSLKEVEPWEILDDDEFILMQDPDSGEICYCSVLGGLGMVFSIHVYIGGESYRFMQRVLKGKPFAPADFYGTTRAVMVEYVPARGQKPPDRELLTTFGHPVKRGTRAPIFRAVRPGYNPWYLTEKEGKLLALCLRGILALCITDPPAGDIDYWEQEDVFPFLTPKQNDATRSGYEVQLVKAPEPPSTRPPAAALDEGQINDILRRLFPQRGFLEADHFFAMAEIGERDERKACVSAAVVCDGDSGYAFQPELGMPGEPSGGLLVRAILGAIRSNRVVPREIRVRKQEFKFLLEDLSARLGCEIRVKKSLPMLDPFKKGLLGFMGDPGESPIE